MTTRRLAFLVAFVLVEWPMKIMISLPASGEGSENMSCEIVSLEGVCCGIIRDGSPIVAFLKWQLGGNGI